MDIQDDEQRKKSKKTKYTREELKELGIYVKKKRDEDTE